MDASNLALLGRLPLADAVFSVLDYCLNDDLCRSLFDEHRGRCYEDRLTFHALIGLVLDALTLHGGSANRSIGRAIEEDRLNVVSSSVYRKLGNLPPELSQALLSSATTRLSPLIQTPAHVLPSCFDSLEVLVFDGKKLKHAAKRLLAARPYSTGSLLGGKLLVALSLSSGLAVAMNACEDGERNDVPLVEGLLNQLRPLRQERPYLFVADRQFADLNLPGRFTHDGNHFVLRCGKTLLFQADSTHPSGQGLDDQQRPFTDQRGLIGRVADKRRRLVRRVTLTLAGGQEVILITDLLDESIWPAQKLLELYRMRWHIEEAFQQVSEVFALARLIGASPRGILFQSALCLLMYNITLAIKSRVAVAGQKTMQEVSTENLFYDATRELTAYNVLADAATPPPPAPRDKAAMQARLDQLLGTLWHSRWIKKKDKSPRKPLSKKPLPGGHASLHKLMQTAKPHKTQLP